MTYLKSIVFCFAIISSFQCLAMKLTDNSREAFSKIIITDIRHSERTWEQEASELSQPETIRQYSSRHSVFYYESLSSIKNPLSSIERPLSTEPINTKVILSIDGGGSRGIIPLYYIKALEQAISGPLKVDMISGTSVGAILGAAVALKKANILHKNFQGFANQIFVKKWFSFRGTLKPIYKSKSREQVILNFLGGIDGRKLDVSFVVPFYSLGSMKTVIYKNFGECEDFQLSDILMMTSAAPTYFNPHKCRSSTGQYYEGLDGGIFANHPGLIAYHEAKEMFPLSKIILISLGTGQNISPKGRIKCFDNKSLVYWARNFPEMSIGASSHEIHSRLISLSRSDRKFEYIRFNPELQEKDLLLDGVDPRYIQKLKTIAKLSILERGSEHENFKRAIAVLASKK